MECWRENIELRIDLYSSGAEFTAEEQAQVRRLMVSLSAFFDGVWDYPGGYRLWMGVPELWQNTTGISHVSICDMDGFRQPWVELLNDSGVAA